jgi:hypothetical protein
MLRSAVGGTCPGFGAICVCFATTSHCMFLCRAYSLEACGQTDPSPGAISSVGSCFQSLPWLASSVPTALKLCGQTSCVCIDLALSRSSVCVVFLRETTNTPVGFKVCGAPWQAVWLRELGAGAADLQLCSQAARNTTTAGGARSARCYACRTLAAHTPPCTDTLDHPAID